MLPHCQGYTERDARQGAAAAMIELLLTRDKAPVEGFGPPVGRKRPWAIISAAGGAK